MAGFSSYDEVINAWATGKGQPLMFTKTMASVSVSGVPHSGWTASGNPSAGTYGTLGKANGRVLTKASTGAFAFSNPTAPATMHMTSAEAYMASTGGILIVDRISDVLIAHAEATGSFTGLDATSRLDSGGGAMIWAEVQSALSAASNTLALTYTNEGGTGSRTCNVVTVASAIVNRSVNALLFQTLQAGDKGVRSIQSLTLTGSATGSVALALVRPLAWIPIGVASIPVARDLVSEIPLLPKIRDDACLSFIWVPGAAATPAFGGMINIAQN